MSQALQCSFICYRHGRLDVVTHLIEECECDINDTHTTGETALHFAAR